MGSVYVTARRFVISDPPVRLGPVTLVAVEEEVDFVSVGDGSARGWMPLTFLSNRTVALLEAGRPPPVEELVHIACQTLRSTTEMIAFDQAVRLTAFVDSNLIAGRVFVQSGGSLAQTGTSPGPIVI